MALGLAGDADETVADRDQDGCRDAEDRGEAVAGGAHGQATQTTAATLISRWIVLSVMNNSHTASQAGVSTE